MSSTEEQTNPTSSADNSKGGIFGSNKDNKYITDHPEYPELYTKRAIHLFSAFFSTIFGTFLLLSNMKSKEYPFGRMVVILFGIAYTVLVIYVVNMMETPGLMALVWNSIGGFILKEGFWNKYIGKETMHRKKKIWKPLIISTLISIPFILAAIYNNSL